jgi:DNA-binding transcriptional regulator YiaG
MSKRKTVKRNIFSELMEGLDAMKEHREGKVTLRTHKLPVAAIEESPGAEFFVAVRKEFNVSRSVWANMLRVSPRTVEKWEQGGQVSPLAATFVELVSHYPDTIERLQTLPKYVSHSEDRTSPPTKRPNRPRAVQTVNHASNAKKLRARYLPPKIKVLFVGEAPPAGGTFFYAGNSQMYRHLRETLQSRLGDPHDFLQAFKDRGYFLDDLVLEPFDQTPAKERAPILRQNIPLLAQRMTRYQPEIVITLLKRIGPYVQDAISQAGADVKHYCVSFPGNGQQGNFRREMADIAPLLP